MRINNLKNFNFINISLKVYTCKNILISINKCISINFTTFAGELSLTTIILFSSNTNFIYWYHHAFYSQIYPEDFNIYLTIGICHVYYSLDRHFQLTWLLDCQLCIDIGTESWIIYSAYHLQIITRIQLVYFRVNQQVSLYTV